MVNYAYHITETTMIVLSVWDESLKLWWLYLKLPRMVRLNSGGAYKCHVSGQIPVYFFKMTQL